MRPESAVLIDGRPDHRIPVTDRGFLFGDGVFESIAVFRRKAPLWPWHLQRLSRSAQLLGLNLENPAGLIDEVLAVAGDTAAVRLIVTRGDALEPGYAPLETSRVRRVLMAMALPPVRDGLRAAVAAGGLVDGDPGAGLKHLSRLPQVLLAKERADRGLDELLVTNGDGQLREATQGNLLVRLDGRWFTPPAGSGVNGVFRDYLCEKHAVAERPLALEDLDRATALAICNALRGIEPVVHVEGIGSFDADSVKAWAAEVVPWR